MTLEELEKELDDKFGFIMAMDGVNASSMMILLLKHMVLTERNRCEKLDESYERLFEKVWDQRDKTDE